MIPFSFNQNRFSFSVADHLLVGQLCTNPKSDRGLLSCLKVTQCSTSEIGDAPLYNSCTLPIQVMDHCQHPQNANPDSSTCRGWWKQSFRLRLWSLVWFQVRATSCHLKSSKLAWKSTPKCTWMCWRVWWSPGAIRWPVADPGCGCRTAPAHKSKETQAWLQKECYDFEPFSHLSPSSPDLNPLDNLFGYTSRTSPTWPPTTLKPAWLPPSTEYSPSSRWRLWKRHAPSSGSVSRRWLRLKATTLNRCQLYYIIKLPELIFQ